MPKINGKLEGATLALGSNSKDPMLAIDYASKLSKMDLDSLYKHGMSKWNIRPTKSIKAREMFEKKCVAAFRRTK